MKRIMYFALVVALLISSGCGTNSAPVDSSKPSERNTFLRSENENEDDSVLDRTNSMTNTDGDSLEDIDLIEDINVSDVRDLSAGADTEPITRDGSADVGAGSITKDNILSIIGDMMSTDAKGLNVNSKEAAAIAYLEALRDADIKRMVDAFYIDKYTENYDLVSEMIKKRQYSFQTMGYPNSNEFATSIHEVRGKTDVYDQIVGQYAMLGAYESRLDVPLLNDDNSIVLEDETEVREFVAQLEVILDAPKLDAIRIIGFIEPEKIFDGSSDYVKNDNYLRFADMVYADNAASCIVVFEIESNMYLLCVDVVDYGGEWFVSSLNGFGGMEIERSLGISHSIHGLVPLFAINAYDGAYNNEILRFREIVLTMIDVYEDQGIASATNTSSPVVSYDEPGYSSPEEAGRAFLEALRDTDLDRIMSVCGIAHYAENFDFEAYYMRFRMYSKINYDARMPNVNDFTKAINIENIKIHIITELGPMYYSLCYYEDRHVHHEDSDSLDYWGPQTLTDNVAETANELVEKFNAAVNALNLDTLIVLGVISIERYSELQLSIFEDDPSRYDIYYGEMNQENILKQNMHTGAERVGECIAYFEINDHIYILCLSAIEYNGKWYVRSFTGNNFSSISRMPENLDGLMPISLIISEYGEEVVGFNEEALRAAFE